MYTQLIADQARMTNLIGTEGAHISVRMPAAHHGVEAVAIYLFNDEINDIIHRERVLRHR